MNIEKKQREYKPLRILYVNGGTMDYGGISTCMMNFYRHFDRNLLQVDFIVHGQGGIYDNEIISLGGKVFHIPTKRQNLMENLRAIDNIMDEGKYSIIHTHMDGMNGLMLKKAKKHGIPIRISHSHNTDYLTNNKIKRLFHEYSRKQIPKYATYAFACSEMAGRWLYRDKIHFDIIHNAIDIEKYVFNANIRDKLRNDMGLKDKFIIGHIGRFDYQKNHKFLISTFSKYSKINPKAVLVLIGDGDLRTDIENQIKFNGIQDKVLLLGRRSNICDLLNIFDVFAFPSRFEGLGIVAIEAQANGLPCVLSSKIPKEAVVAKNNIILDFNIDDWVNAFEVISSDFHRKDDNISALIQAGYDIKLEANNLQKKYFNLYEMQDQFSR